MSSAGPDAQRARDWLLWCAAHPGGLPDGVAPVHARLVRRVGVGALPDGGRGFLKQMAFPRWKHRLRYLFRPLPLRHEAAMLRRVVAAGIPAPEVLACLGRRSFGIPVFSGLVTRGLPVDMDRAEEHGTLGERGALAARLVGVGLHHPDLHRGNFVRLDSSAGGALAVLDLQSVRAQWLGAGVSRRAMAARLLLEEADSTAGWPELVAAGLVQEPERQRVLNRVDRLRVRALRRIVLRCMGTSTDFVREGFPRRLVAPLWRRRSSQPEGQWYAMGAEAKALWIADRYLEQTVARPASLWALRTRPWWRGGGGALYSAVPPAEWPQVVAQLKQAHEQWTQQQRRGRQVP